MRCQQTWNRHKWTVTKDGTRIICRRCGKERNPEAGRVNIESKKPWNPGPARRNALRAAFGLPPMEVSR